MASPNGVASGADIRGDELRRRNVSGKADGKAAYAPIEADDKKQKKVCEFEKLPSTSAVELLLVAFKIDYTWRHG